MLEGRGRRFPSMFKLAAVLRAFAVVAGLALDSQNNLYAADPENNRITKFPAAGGVVTGGAAPAG